MHRLDQILYYLRESPMLAAGLCMILLVVLFGILGPIFVDTSKAQPLATPPRQAPSLEHPFGTDDSGRDLLAVMVVGVPLTMRIGLLAGTVGLGLGIFLGFTSGYMGGKIDTVIRGPRGYAADGARPRGAGLHCLDDPRGNQRQHHGLGGGFAGVDVAHADDSLAGFDHARASVRADGQAQRHEQRRDHLEGTFPQSVALPRGQFYQCRQLGHSLVDWPRGARLGASRTIQRSA